MSATKAGSAARQTQMNTRIDAELKVAGDAALARLGYTPSAGCAGSGGSLWTTRTTLRLYAR